MAKSFSSFKELLIKKDLSDEKSAEDIRYDVLTRIFQNISPKLMANNIQHFDDKEQKVILSVYQLEEIKSPSEQNTQGEIEAKIRSTLNKVSDKTKFLLTELLEKEADESIRESKKIEKLAKKYQPKDAGEELEATNDKIKDIKADIIEIEMKLMMMEKDEMKNSEPYKKLSNARERRRQLVSKLEKQKLGIEKRLKTEK